MYKRTAITSNYEISVAFSDKDFLQQHVFSSFQKCFSFYVCAYSICRKSSLNSSKLINVILTSYSMFCIENTACEKYMYRDTLKKMPIHYSLWAENFKSLF